MDFAGTTKSINRKTTMEGKYILTIEGLEDNGIFANFSVNNKYSLPTNLIRGIAVYAAREKNLCGKFSTSVFTSCKLHLDDRDKIFRCTSKYAQDGQWYDWCLVEWENSTNVIQTYPELVLGFIQVGMKDCAIVQSSNDPISIEKMLNDFICKFTMPPNTPTSVIKIESISSPLCVFKNCGGY
jgi:hypothetical protein